MYLSGNLSAVDLQKLSEYASKLGIEINPDDINQVQDLYSKFQEQRAQLKRAREGGSPPPAITPTVTIPPRAPRSAFPGWVIPVTIGILAVGALAFFMRK